MADEPLVSADEVASVLAGSTDTDQPADAHGDGPRPFSLRRPLAISPEAEVEARERVDQLAKMLVETLARQLSTTIESETRGFQQQQVQAALDSLPDPTWILSFHHATRGGIALAMDPDCSMSVVELALGGPGNSSSGGREPTSLESRVMNNLALAMIRRLAGGRHAAFSGASFSLGTLPAGVAAGGEMVGTSLLRLKLNGNERSAMLLATAALLREADSRPAAPGQVGPLAPRLLRVPLQARPVLGVGRVSLRDLADLEPGSVLHFETPEDASLELRVAGHTLFHGRVVRDNERNEFQVTRRRGMKNRAAVRDDAKEKETP